MQLLTLSETWIKQDVSDGEYEIPAYKLFRKYRDGKILQIYKFHMLLVFLLLKQIIRSA